MIHAGVILLSKQMLDVGMSLWRCHVFIKFSDQLLSELGRVVEKDRQGEVADTNAAQVKLLHPHLALAWMLMSRLAQDCLLCHGY